MDVGPSGGIGSWTSTTRRLAVRFIPSIVSGRPARAQAGEVMASLPTLKWVTQLPRLQPRAPDSNKGMFGRILVVAGSRGMSGAAVLCASAALRSGAGLVRLAVPAEVLPIVASANPCYLTAPL